MSQRLRKQCKGAFANKMDWEQFCGEWWKIVTGKDSEEGLADVEARITDKLQWLQTMVMNGGGMPERGGGCSAAHGQVRQHPTAVGWVLHAWTRHVRVPLDATL